MAEISLQTWKTLHHKAVILGGECTFVAVTLSAYLLASHFASYHRPEEQKWVVAIIFMVPIYGVDSWLSLLSNGSSLAFNMARDCYEAYAIYAFGSYLVSCLGGTEGVITVLHNLGLGDYTPEPSVNDSEKGRSAQGRPSPPSSPRPPGVVVVNNGMPPAGTSSSSDDIPWLTPVTSKLAWVFGRGRRSVGAGRGGPSTLRPPPPQQQPQQQGVGAAHRRAGSDGVAGQGFYGTLAAGGGRKSGGGFRHEVRHPAPLCWLAPWQMGEPFFLNFKFAIIQYVTLKVLCTIMEGILRACGAYGEGSFRFNKGYLYLVIIQNFSQCWALYCLVQFYYATQGVLAPRRPLLKFLCIKMVIFVTWWQGLALAALDAFGYIPGSEQVSAATVRSAVQDLLICCEMCVAAIAHMYAFPASYYANLEPDRSAMQLGGIDTQPLLASGSGGYGTVGRSSVAVAALVGGEDGAGGGAQQYGGESLLKQVLSPGGGDSAKCIGDMEPWDPEQGAPLGHRTALPPDARHGQGFPPGYAPGGSHVRDGPVATYGTTVAGEKGSTCSPSRKPRAWKNIQRGMKDAVVGSGRSVVEDIREFMVDPMARQLDAAQDFGIGLGKAALNAIPGVATTSFESSDRKLAKKAARAPKGPLMTGPGAARNLRRKLGAGRGGKLLWEGVEAAGGSGGDSGSGAGTPGGGGDASSGVDEVQGGAAWIDVSGHGGRPRIIFGGGGDEPAGEEFEGYYDYSTEEEVGAPPDGPSVVNAAAPSGGVSQPAPDGASGTRIGPLSSNEL